MYTPLFLSFCLLTSQAIAQRTCWNPDGSEALNNFPCNPDAEQSVCCGGASNAGDVCLDNKVCLSNGVETIRGTCTDQSWGSAECPGWCLDAGTGGTDLISCQNVTGSSADYCCDHTNNCCDTGVGRFQILPSAVATSATWNSALTAYETVTGYETAWTNAATWISTAATNEAAVTDASSLSSSPAAATSSSSPTTTPATTSTTSTSGSDMWGYATSTCAPSGPYGDTACTTRAELFPLNATITAGSSGSANATASITATTISVPAYGSGACTKDAKLNVLRLVGLGVGILALC